MDSTPTTSSTAQSCTARAELNGLGHSQSSSQIVNTSPDGAAQTILSSPPSVTSAKSGIGASPHHAFHRREVPASSGNADAFDFENSTSSVVDVQPPPSVGAPPSVSLGTANGGASAQLDSVSITGTELNAIETALEMHAAEPATTFDFSDFLINRCGSNAVLAFSSICLLVTAIANSIFFKKMTNHMVNYPWFLAQLSTVVYVPVFFGIVWLSGDAITPEMRNFPKFQFFVMGVFDALSGVLAMFGGVHTSGSLQALLSNAIIPFTMILAYFWVNERFTSLQVLGSLVIMLGVCAAMQPSLASDDAGVGDNQPFFVFLYFLNNLPSAVSSVYKEVAFKGVDMDVNYLQAWVVWWQLLFGFALIPLNTLSILGRDRITWGELPSAFMNGLWCLLGYNHYKLPKCHPNPAFAEYHEYESPSSSSHSSGHVAYLELLTDGYAGFQPLPGLGSTTSELGPSHDAVVSAQNSSIAALHALASAITDTKPVPNVEHLVYADPSRVTTLKADFIERSPKISMPLLLRDPPTPAGKSDARWSWQTESLNTSPSQPIYIARHSAKPGSASSSRVRDLESDRFFAQTSKSGGSKALTASEANWDNDSHAAGMPTNSKPSDDLPECDACQNAWIMTTLYLSFNMLYNYFMIVVIKHGGASLMYIIMTLRLPLVQLAFSVKAINDPPDSFGLPEFIGLVAILAGMALYKRGESVSEPAKEEGEIPTEATRLLQPGEEGYGAIKGMEPPPITTLRERPSTVLSAAFLHSLAGNAGLHHASRIDVLAYQRWQEQQAEARRRAEAARAALLRKKTALQQRASYYSKLHITMQEARRGMRASASVTSPHSKRATFGLRDASANPIGHQGPDSIALTTQSQISDTEPAPSTSILFTAPHETTTSFSRKNVGAQARAGPLSVAATSSTLRPPLIATPQPQTQTASQITPEGISVPRPSTPRSSGGVGSTFFTPHRERMQAAAAAAGAGGSVPTPPSINTSLGQQGSTTEPPQPSSAIISGRSWGRGAGSRARLSQTTLGSTSTAALPPALTTQASQSLATSPGISPQVQGPDVSLSQPQSPPIANVSTVSIGSPSLGSIGLHDTITSSPPSFGGSSMTFYASNAAKRTQVARGATGIQLQPLQASVSLTSTQSQNALSTISSSVSGTPRLTAQGTPMYAATNAPQILSAAMGAPNLSSGVDVVIVTPSSRQNSPLLDSNGRPTAVLPPPVLGLNLDETGSAGDEITNENTNSALSAAVPFIQSSMLDVSTPTEPVAEITAAIIPLLSPPNDSHVESQEQTLDQPPQGELEVSHQNGHGSEQSFIGSTFESIGGKPASLSNEPILTPGDLRRQALIQMIASSQGPLVQGEDGQEEDEESLLRQQTEEQGREKPE